LSERYKYHRLTGEEKAKLVKVIREVLEGYGVELAIIFGSFVELESFRDIDIAIYKPNLDLNDVLRLSIELEEKLGIPVDVIPITEVNPQFRIRILARGLIVLEKAGVYEYMLMRAFDESMLMEKSR